MTRCCIHRLDRSEESRHDLHVKTFLPICCLHPVKLTATEIEEEMQDLVNKARCIARKRSGEKPADAPTKVKRVRCLLDKGSCTAGKRSGELTADSPAKVKLVLIVVLTNWTWERTVPQLGKRQCSSRLGGW